MSKESPTQKKPARSKSTAPLGVHVILSAEDHKAASLAALLSHETLSEWIAGLVNTALMP